MREFMTLMKALADESRVRILLALAGRELCVCQIVELLGLAPSTVSKHMSILKQARLVDARKAGRWINYRLADEDPLPETEDVTALAIKLLSGDARIKQDAKKLKHILRMDPEELCRRQSECK